ncbi:MAG: YbjN domain-containing protein [Planctomycetota bacterium]|nr:MAG: YbjN domain-containing protein [Planctomycetota bacterium]
MRTRIALSLFAALCLAATVVSPPAWSQTREEVRKAIDTLEKALERLPDDDADAATQPVTYERIAAALRSFDIEPTTYSNDEGQTAALIFRVNNLKALAFLDDNTGVMQFAFSVGGSKADMERINRWNRERRFTRAFFKTIKGRKVAALEAEFDVKEGRSDERLRTNVGLFVQSLRTFLREVCQ